MTKSENNKILLSYTIIFFCLTCINVVNAQTTEKIIDNLVVKLQNKVLLTEKQAEDIKSSLNVYFSTPTEENRALLQTKVESILDGRQKVKYNIVKDDWWKNVRQELNKVKRN